MGPTFDWLCDGYLDARTAETCYDEMKPSACVIVLTLLFLNDVSTALALHVGLKRTPRCSYTHAQKLTTTIALTHTLRLGLAWKLAEEGLCDPKVGAAAYCMEDLGFGQWSRLS